MKEEREYWKGKAEAYSTQPSRQPEAQPDPYASLDWEDSRDVRKAFDSIREENSRMREEMKNAVTALNTRAERKDWDSMVSTHVPQLTNENPMFAEMIQKASNPYEAAYLLAELRAKNAQPTQQPNQPVMMQQNAERAITNANKPQTLSSIGGGGTLSASDYYASMSDEDFMKVASRNMAGI
jgi:hypothetical protein